MYEKQVWAIQEEEKRRRRRLYSHKGHLALCCSVPGAISLGSLGLGESICLPYRETHFLLLWGELLVH